MVELREPRVDGVLTPITHWRLSGGCSLVGFTQSVLVRVPGGLDHEALSAAVAAVVAPGMGAVLTRVDSVAALEDYGRFDSALEPMVRVVWCDGGSDAPGHLRVVAHQLGVDGRVLVSALASAYRAVVMGEPPVVGRGGMSAEGRAGELDLWKGILEPAPGLGFRRRPARDLVGTVRSITRELSEVDTELVVTGLPRAHGFSVNEVLLAALAAAVAPWRGSPVVVVDVAGTHPVRLDIGEVDWPQLWSGGPVVGDVLGRIGEQLRAIPDNGVGYGFLRTCDALEALPTPDICFNYVEAVDGWDIVEFRNGNDPSLPCAYSLELTAGVNDGRLSFTVSWPEALFTEDEIAELADTWVRVLSAFAAHAG